MAGELSFGGFRMPISRCSDAVRREWAGLTWRWGAVLVAEGGGEAFLTKAPPAIAQNRNSGLSLFATPDLGSAAQLPPSLFKQCLKRKTFGQRQPDLACSDANAGAELEQS